MRILCYWIATLDARAPDEAAGPDFWSEDVLVALRAMQQRGGNGNVLAGRRRSAFTLIAFDGLTRLDHPDLRERARPTRGVYQATPSRRITT
jgi:hypothetical protein